MKRVLMFALVLTLSATGARADRYEDCALTKDLDLTIRSCTQIIERGKKETRKVRFAAYLRRGFAYEDKGELDRAIADWTKSIKLYPSYANIYAVRGLAYRKKGEFDRAIADFTQAIKINPKDAEFYYHRGFVYRKKGDKEQAIADFRRALKIDPSYRAAKDQLELLGVTP